jgi:hypothetical protein
MSTEQQQKLKHKKMLQRRTIIATIVILLLVIAGFLLALSTEKVISGIWSTLLPIVLLVLAIAIPFLQALFPVSPIAADQLERTQASPDAAGECKISCVRGHDKQRMMIEDEGERNDQSESQERVLQRHNHSECVAG